MTYMYFAGLTIQSVSENKNVINVTTISVPTFYICPRAASEFCKLSGLLCSYGLYQVVCHDQLLLYCRGNATSFSARVMATDNSGKCMHTSVTHFSFKNVRDGR